MPFVDLKTQYQSLKPQIQERINRVLEHGQYIMGPEVEELEEKLAAYTGAKHCITVGSGTDALLISLMGLGIEAGDEVITTPFSFVATAEVIVLLGAKPVFVDIEPSTCNIDARKLEEKITSKTKAIIPVSLYGQPADLDEINGIAYRYGSIPVIEDAAQSFGAEYKGLKSCNLSTIGCTSFFPSKPLGCYGDGGAIFTNDSLVAKACREIRIHGQTDRYVHPRVGVGGRMDTMQCAILLAKLERFDWELEQRIRIGQRYTEEIRAFSSPFKKSSDNLSIEPVLVKSDRTSVYGQYTCTCENRDLLILKLRSAGIPAAIHYPRPINEQHAYKNQCCVDCTPVASYMAKRVVSLPISADITVDQQITIIKELRRLSVL
ncbi:MAG: DegT/DnrJ/EryC1/StrS family aminotransferase [Bacteroidetes bacterium]|nr:DegT/DnrJ/EryC1/StrS family aminotransferase [Bacteroidota bacterium]